jgi:hypothetical protein
MYNKKLPGHPGSFSSVRLSLEIGLFSGGSFLSGFLGSLFGHFLSLFALALALVALAVAAIAIVALALAGALAVHIALAAFALIAAALAQQTLSPSNDLVAVGSDHINSAGNSSQSGNDLQNDRQNFHNSTSYNKYFHLLV